MRVTTPKLVDVQTAKEPLWTAKRAHQEKLDRYCKNWNTPVEDVHPLIFESFGGWAPQTYEELKLQMKAITGEDETLFAKVWRDLRSRIAVALAVGQAKIIQYLVMREPRSIEGDLGVSSNNAGSDAGVVAVGNQGG